MQRSRLGRTGLDITRIGFGSIPIQRLALKEAVTVLRRALDMGVGLIDTARSYTDSEEKIGTALRGRAERPVLMSKSYSRDADGIRRDVETSLEKLGASAIEVYLLHNVNTVSLLDQVTSSGGALEGLRRAAQEGLVKFVGISGHKPPILAEALRRDAFDVLEFPFNAIEQEAASLIEEAARRDVGTIIMKPLAGGALRPASAAIRFVLTYPVSCVIPGIQALNEVAEDLSADGKLSDEERQALLQQAAQWKGRFCRRCEYCLQACPNNVNITLILLFAAYSKRYGLKDWARDRYAALPVRVDACEDCGKCEERCPYDLPIREMLREAHAELAR